MVELNRREGVWKFLKVVRFCGCYEEQRDSSVKLIAQSYSVFGARMIPTGARKKFKTDVLPSDRQLWAIGMVVVRWSLIEQLIRAYVHSFTDENDSNDPVRKVFDATRPLTARLDQWEELARQHIQAGWIESMLALINEVRQLADQRDKIVHGV